MTCKIILKLTLKSIMKINLAEIDDTQASYIRNMGDDAAKHFPIHDLTLKWNKM